MSFFGLVVFLLAGYLLQQYFLHHSLDNISYQIRPDRKFVECDEEFKIITTIANNKRLPVFFLRLSEMIPEKMRLVRNEKGITRHKISNAITSNTASLNQTLYILSYQKVTSSLAVSLSDRGRYILRGAELSAGDLLGINDSTLKIRTAAEIIVYPRKIHSQKLTQTFGGYIGDILVNRFIMPDPIETAGFREYTGREPMKDISWKQTVRYNRMMVKQYDYTANIRVSVILDIEGNSEEETERSYEITRSICEQLENRQIRYDFNTNAAFSGISNIWSSIPEGSGSQHLNTVLEGLGRGEYTVLCSADELYSRSTSNNDDGRSYILVTAHPEEKKDCLAKYERILGRKILLIDVREYSEEADA